MTSTQQTISRSAVSATDDGTPEPPDFPAFDVDVDDADLARAEEVMQDYEARLVQATESYPHRLAQWQERQQAAGLLQAGEPILSGGYQYWNCLTAGPFQLFGNPPYRPGNIIAGGELAFFLAAIWVNPASSPGGGLPGTTVLGGRSYEACFETVNVTDVVDGPSLSVSSTFAGIAPVVTTIPWFFVAADPGPRPKIFETHFAVDVTVPGQPFAAMATWHLDPNADPGFLFVPPVPAQLQHDIPARYMVYRR